jgi:hypothetical protein
MDMIKKCSCLASYQGQGRAGVGRNGQEWAGIGGSGRK